tara:strand:- start:450 stop:914 length:465 start_codon:yes stop_codon:yes gene_type:complete
MGGIQYLSLIGNGMSVHRGEWRVHASAVDDIRVIEDSLAWLCGDGVKVSTQRENSTLGAPMYIISANMTAKQSRFSLSRLESESINQILKSGLESKIDQDQFLHLRIDLAALTMGKARVTSEKDTMIVKGKFKLEVYPGQFAYKVANSIFERLG